MLCGCCCEESVVIDGHTQAQFNVHVEGLSQPWPWFGGRVCGKLGPCGGLKIIEIGQTVHNCLMMCFFHVSSCTTLASSDNCLLVNTYMFLSPYSLMHFLPTSTRE